MPSSRARKCPGAPMPSTGRPRRAPHQHIDQRQRDRKTAAKFHHPGQVAVAGMVIIVAVALQADLSGQVAGQAMDFLLRAGAGDDQAPRSFRPLVKLARIGTRRRSRAARPGPGPSKVPRAAKRCGAWPAARNIAENLGGLDLVDDFAEAFLRRAGGQLEQLEILGQLRGSPFDQLPPSPTPRWRHPHPEGVKQSPVAGMPS